MSNDYELRVLSDREFQVMQVLWSADKMTASEIASFAQLSINTVHAIVKKLLNANYLKVAEIVYSGTVLSRAYQAVISYEEYTMERVLQDYQKARKNISFPNIVATLMEYENNDNDIVEQLEALLQERKRKLDKKCNNE